MIALASKEVLMGKHSSLGPIDPQVAGLPAHGVIEEFQQAKNEIAADPSTMAVWQPIIAKYPPAFIGECAKAISWADSIVRQWLVTCMFVNEQDPASLADKILGELSNHALTLSHSRHISAEKARELGIRIKMLEDDDRLQEAVLTVHHAYVQTLAETAAFKLIENQKGVAFIASAQPSR